MARKHWLITGASKGFGAHWTERALARGDRVAALVRTKAALDDLAATYPESLHVVAADVTDRARVQAAVTEAHDRLGRLDVVVSNAGIGLFGAVEETSEPQARAQFDTNFFGSLWVIQAVLPILRAQQGGHIVQVSSYLGVTTLPFLGLYNASKWAVEGLVSSLAAEVHDFGITTTLVEPGLFGTDWSGSAPHADSIPAYDLARAEFFNVPLEWVDPVNTHVPLFAAVDADTPPARLFLGSYPHPVVAADYRSRLGQWDAWSDVAATADVL